MQQLFMQQFDGRQVDQPTEGDRYTRKRKTIMRSSKLFATVVAVLMCAPALADDVKVGVGISGWTGFAPLTQCPLFLQHVAL
jgi:hypothetical protein